MNRGHAISIPSNQRIEQLKEKLKEAEETYDLFFKMNNVNSHRLSKRANELRKKLAKLE